MKTIIKAVTLAGTSLIMAFASASSYADITISSAEAGGTNTTFKTVAGIIPPSYPNFIESINASLTKSSTGSVFTASFDANKNVSNIVKSSTSYFPITNTVFSLTANFGSNNGFKSGSMSISGTVAGLGINSPTTLMSATLTKFDSKFDGAYIGFNTKNIVCDPRINAYVGGCSTSESVIFKLENNFTFSGKGWTSKGMALTSVPIPAAAWLFGSGLLGLAGIARRKKTTSV